MGAGDNRKDAGDKRRADKRAPPAPDTRPGKNPGYPETEPRDKEDARQSHPRRRPSPDAGGIRRKRDAGSDDGPPPTNE